MAGQRCSKCSLDLTGKNYTVTCGGGKPATYMCDYCPYRYHKAECNGTNSCDAGARCGYCKSAWHLLIMSGDVSREQFDDYTFSWLHDLDPKIANRWKPTRIPGGNPLDRNLFDAIPDVCVAHNTQLCNLCMSDDQGDLLDFARAAVRQRNSAAAGSD
jgi:hypothetical protein